MNDPRFLTSRETLGASLQHNGIPGMARTSAPEVPNMYSGPDAQVALNNQPVSQERLRAQSSNKMQEQQLVAHRLMLFNRHVVIN